MKSISGTNKVLVVDDEAEIREALIGPLLKMNIECLQAANGKEALAILEKYPYDVGAVLCDIMMPEMDGLECLASAQAKGLLAPFIFVTGYGDNSRTRQAIRLGAIDFIGKPFNSEEVVEVVFRALDIGLRRNRIFTEIKKKDPELLERIKSDEKMISLMRVNNNMRRTK